MERINYQHLLYFWAAAREGGIVRAAALLRRSQPTVSTQIHRLEADLGAKLFTRAGRRLILTETGHLVFRYAGEIFSLGQELKEAARGAAPGHSLRLVVGVADVLPKLVVHRLLEPALRLPERVQIICREDKPDQLLAALSLHEYDVILSDAPANPTVNVRSFSHLLGECGVTFLGTARHATLRRGFPKSLDGAPMLAPAETSALWRALDQWFHKLDIRPSVVGRFDDSALLKIFGQAGEGVFVSPSVIEAHVRRAYGIQVIGRTNEVRDRFYAISVDRKIKHPAVMAITSSAKRELFKESTPPKAGSGP